VTEPPRIASLDELRPDVRGLVIQWRDALSQLGIALRILETRRTKERQDWLYAQGRTRPGKIVTNLRGDDPKARHVAEPGRASAVDFAFAGPKPFDAAHPWELAASAAEWLGFTSGHRWKMRDSGHLQFDKLAPRVS
jgi:hypothetical protein